MGTGTREGKGGLNPNAGPSILPRGFPGDHGGFMRSGGTNQRFLILATIVLALTLPA